jgi:quercetin dioxygenase-like cupin family protein
MDTSKKSENRVPLKDIPWESPAPGVRNKSFNRNGQRLRLVEFSDTFVEDEWCTKGHIGYVLEGELSIDYNGRSVKYAPGDGIFIEEGAESKHKAIVPRGKKALLILVEKA